MDISDAVTNFAELVEALSINNKGLIYHSRQDAGIIYNDYFAIASWIKGGLIYDINILGRKSYFKPSKKFLESVKRIIGTKDIEIVEFTHPFMALVSSDMRLRHKQVSNHANTTAVRLEYFLSDILPVQQVIEDIHFPYHSGHRSIPFPDVIEGGPNI